MPLRAHRIVTAVTLCLSLSLLVYTLFKPVPKFAYVDSVRLINGYTGMVDARKAYQQKTSGWQANIDTLAKEVQRQLFKYEKESSAMTQKERDLTRELIRSKRQQLADYQQALSAQAQQEDSQMTNTVLIQINAYIKKYGEEHGYQVILGATEYGNLAYADTELDVTKAILDGLNKEYKGK